MSMGPIRTDEPICSVRELTKKFPVRSSAVSALGIGHRSFLHAIREVNLDIVPGDGMDADQLRAWYGRHGFVSRPGHMWRPAKGGER